MKSISDALADLDEEKVLELVRDELAAGTIPGAILTACQEGMTEVGARFERGDYFVSDLMMSGEIFKEVTGLLEPGLGANEMGGAGKVVIGTVEGDIHDLGKDIVVTMLRSANFDVTDLGVDVPSERFVAAMEETGATVLGLSGLLTVAFDSMKETVDALQEAGLREHVKVMIGGGPTNADVCRSVGADDWGADAQAAIRLSKKWLEG